MVSTGSSVGLIWLFPCNTYIMRNHEACFALYSFRNLGGGLRLFATDCSAGLPDAAHRYRVTAKGVHVETHDGMWDGGNIDKW